MADCSFFSAKYGDRRVTIYVLDLDAFIHAGPDATVAVTGSEGDQYAVRKGDLQDFEVIAR